jgi:zinc transport system permease protein
MLVVPVAGAAQVSRSFAESLAVSVALAELAVVLGIGLAYYAEATAGGVIVLVAVAVYVCCVAAGKLLSGDDDRVATDGIDAEGSRADGVGE